MTNVYLISVFSVVALCNACGSDYNIQGSSDVGTGDLAQSDIATDNFFADVEEVEDSVEAIECTEDCLHGVEIILERDNCNRSKFQSIRPTPVDSVWEAYVLNNTIDDERIIVNIGCVNVPTGILLSSCSRNTWSIKAGNIEGLHDIYISSPYDQVILGVEGITITKISDRCGVKTATSSLTLEMEEMFESLRYFYEIDFDFLIGCDNASEFVSRQTCH